MKYIFFFKCRYLGEFTSDWGCILEFLIGCYLSFVGFYLENLKIKFWLWIIVLNLLNNVCIYFVVFFYMIFSIKKFYIFNVISNILL